MKSASIKICSAIAISGLTLALNSVAAPATSIASLPAPQNAGEVTYIMGGVGKSEADAIRHVARYYPLEVEFLLKTKPKNEQLSDVKVRIKDANDKTILNVIADGPFLLAKMPAGKYTISAERNRKVEHRQFSIAGNDHQRVVFEWDV